MNYLKEELEKQSHDTGKKAKVKGIPKSIKSIKTFGSSTLDESVKEEKSKKGWEDDLTHIPSMECL